MQIIPVILCGGAGSRLWPVSRAFHPKPFIQLPDGQTFIQKAFLRSINLPSISEILTLTNREFFFKIQEEYGAVNPDNIPVHYILEPYGRNTAPAITIAAMQIIATHEDAIMLILPADHLIQDEAAFQHAVFCAAELATKNYIVTFGIHPREPETGYGYIEIDKNQMINGTAGDLGYSVKKFVEKPDLATAKIYCSSSDYLWNSGMFCFKASVFLEKMVEFSPDVFTAAKACYENSRAKSIDDIKLTLDEKTFKNLQDISIDYALLEPLSTSNQAGQIVVVPSDMGWADIGSWDALGDLTNPDENGNRVSGQALLRNTKDCIIQTDERLVGTIGVNNLIIVDTPDALLVADKTCAQEVKHLYAGLKDTNHMTHKFHRTVHRPWGTFTVLEEGERFKIKRIEVKPGASLSLQMHYHRSEHWIVVQGTAKIINGDEQFLLNSNQSTYIAAGNKHRLENPGIMTLVMIEVQSGEYLGEDDIVRFEDSYGRDKVC